mmetsp:Transcript_35407/g.92157  ORF Transcript_35407/g.92157 Transcript_35407/m.92157 type:complete len:355 (+) Transcript_35407:1869-2933(+)
MFAQCLLSCSQQRLHFVQLLQRLLVFSHCLLSTVITPRHRPLHLFQLCLQPSFRLLQFTHACTLIVQLPSLPCIPHFQLFKVLFECEQLLFHLFAHSLLVCYLVAQLSHGLSLLDEGHLHIFHCLFHLPALFRLLLHLFEKVFHLAQPDARLSQLQLQLFPLHYLLAHPILHRLLLFLHEVHVGSELFDGVLLLVQLQLGGMTVTDKHADLAVQRFALFIARTQLFYQLLPVLLQLLHYTSKNRQPLYALVVLFAHLSCHTSIFFTSFSPVLSSSTLHSLSFPFPSFFVYPPRLPPFSLLPLLLHPLCRHDVHNRSLPLLSRLECPVHSPPHYLLQLHQPPLHCAQLLFHLRPI